MEYSDIGRLRNCVSSSSRQIREQIDEIDNEIVQDISNALVFLDLAQKKLSEAFVHECNFESYHCPICKATPF